MVSEIVEGWNSCVADSPLAPEQLRYVSRYAPGSLVCGDKFESSRDSGGIITRALLLVNRDIFFHNALNGTEPGQPSTPLYGRNNYMLRRLRLRRKRALC